MRQAILRPADVNGKALTHFDGALSAKSNASLRNSLTGLTGRRRRGTIPMYTETVGVRNGILKSVLRRLVPAPDPTVLTTPGPWIWFRSAATR